MFPLSDEVVNMGMRVRAACSLLEGIAQLTLTLHLQLDGSRPWALEIMDFPSSHSLLFTCWHDTGLGSRRDGWTELFHIQARDRKGRDLIPIEIYILRSSILGQEAALKESKYAVINAKIPKSLQIS